jgi:hypothetical protein
MYLWMKRSASTDEAKRLGRDLTNDTAITALFTRALVGSKRLQFVPRANPVSPHRAPEVCYPRQRYSTASLS